MNTHEKYPLPNATAVLVLGICSIVFSCFFVGLILGIIGLALSGKGRSMYHSEPEKYEGYGTLNAGFILSIIGVVLGVIYLIYWIYMWIIIDSYISPWSDFFSSL